MVRGLENINPDSTKKENLFYVVIIFEAIIVQLNKITLFCYRINKKTF